jgi:hypothetical protein
VTSLDEDNVVVFYSLNASDIWLNKRDGLLWERPYKRGITFTWKRVYFQVTYKRGITFTWKRVYFQVTYK